MDTYRKPQVVSRSEWLNARRQLWLHEKAFTHQRDALSAARRALPWVQVTADYRFETDQGSRSLGELFEGRSQLLVYHFMFGPGWSEGCPGCSFLADHFDGVNLHLQAKDVRLVAVSRAPVAEFQGFKRRMGWRFDWVSSQGSTFNSDFGVAPGDGQYNYEPYTGDETELPGLSVFYQDAEGVVFHTYSSFARGLDILVGTYNFLDLLPKGREEEGTMDWVRHHDRYEGEERSSGCCH